MSGHKYSAREGIGLFENAIGQTGLMEKFEPETIRLKCVFTHLVWPNFGFLKLGDID